jgi:hypothetical protein
MQTRPRAKAFLSALIISVLLLAIAFWLMAPESSWPPHDPVLRTLIALLFAGVGTLLAQPGEHRRFVGALFFAMVLCNSVTMYGEYLGIIDRKHRTLIALALTIPFLYLVNTKPHGPKASTK